MSELVRAALAAVVEGKRLSMEEAHGAMGAVMDGEATASQLAALLVALRMRGETVGELAGFATAMRERVVRVDAPAGIIDTCGFPKDSFYYLKSWWTAQAMVHVYPHWNWPDREGQEIGVWCYSNCDEVELSVNGRSLGRKAMENNGHLEWKVAYEPGTLLARGFRGGIEIATDRVDTAGAPAAVRLIPDRAKVSADGEDVAVITVQIIDAQGRIVPVADNEIGFTLDGPARIIGVGNGDPASHEPDRMVDRVSTQPVVDWRMHAVDDTAPSSAMAFDFDDSAWSCLRPASPSSICRRTSDC